MKLKLMNDWEKSTIEDVIKEFSGDRWDWDDNNTKESTEKIGKEIGQPDWFFGSYSYANYSGDAFVLFKKDGQLFEVNGSHCSCYGLEGQWSAEKTTIESIKNRLENELGKNDWCENEFNQGLKDFLKEVGE